MTEMQKWLEITFQNKMGNVTSPEGGSYFAFHTTKHRVNAVDNWAGRAL